MNETQKLIIENKHILEKKQCLYVREFLELMTKIVSDEEIPLELRSSTALAIFSLVSECIFESFKEDFDIKNYSDFLDKLKQSFYMCK